MSDDAVQTIRNGKHISMVKRGHWEYVTRKGVTGIVGIVAITDEGKMLLIEQHRPPVNATVIEIPAGLAGDIAGQESEELSTAAIRELLEETGYQAKRMKYLTEGTASAGITDEVITLFRATGLKKMGLAAGDGGECITVHEVAVEKVEAWLNTRRKKGAKIDLKVYAALYYARQK